MIVVEQCLPQIQISRRLMMRVERTRWMFPPWLPPLPPPPEWWLMSTTNVSVQTRDILCYTSSCQPTRKWDLLWMSVCGRTGRQLQSQQLTVSSEWERLLTFVWPLVCEGYSFQCQHGQAECQGNIYHACVVEKVGEQGRVLDMIKCMINDNFQPEESARKCASQQRWGRLLTSNSSVISPLFCSVDFSAIQSCATGREGEELHYKAGLKTAALNPRVTFIPTIGNQAAVRVTGDCLISDLFYRDRGKSA